MPAKESKNNLKTTVKRPKTVKNTAQISQKEPANDSKYGVFSIAEISKRIELDRATVRKRLDLHKFEPVESRQKLKLYDFDAAMEAVLLETDTKFNDARTRKELAAAEMTEIKVQQAKRELVPLSECIEAIGLTFGSLYKDIAVRLPKRLASRLAKSSESADVQAILTTEIDKIFQELLTTSHSEFLAAAAADLTQKAA